MPRVNIQTFRSSDNYPLGTIFEHVMPSGDLRLWKLTYNKTGPWDWEEIDEFEAWILETREKTNDKVVVAENGAV